MCGVLLRSGSRSLGRRFRHLARRTTTASLAKPLRWLGPNLLFRLSISSDGAAAQQQLISVFGREMYISQWLLVYLSLESLPMWCLCLLYSYSINQFHITSSTSDYSIDIIYTSHYI
jgi:hypothetical protein